MAESILSVGIDIGTSTTSVVFSKIYIENTSGFAKVPQYKIVDKEVIYRSGIYFTPLSSNTRLDVEKITSIVQKEYNAANIKKEEVDTGAVIITGDTARKENAEEVLNSISEYAGDFVVATAGPELESIIAGKGSGADLHSSKYFATVANLDIGGGTTNVSVFDNGKVVDVACFDIGGRLIRFKENTLEIDYCFRKMKDLGEKLGINIKEGNTLTKAEVEKICDHMAEGIVQIIDHKLRSDEYNFYATGGKGFSDSTRIDKVSFSGGIGDLTYRKPDLEDFYYNDIGIILARAINKMLGKYNFDIIEPKETIGATVVGAGTHSTEISGSTITISNPDLLPIKNIPIMKIFPDEEDRIQEVVPKKLEWIMAEEEGHVALALTGDRNISFADIQILAKEIITAMKPIIEANKVLIVVLYHDFAKVLGQSIRTLLDDSIDVIIIDSINVEEGDYIDLGNPIGMGNVLPVIVKTIVFNY